MSGPGIGDQATAFAPATVANVAVGFDVLGFAFPAAGDRVTVEVVERGCDPRIGITAVDGLPGLTTDPAQNTATVAMQSMLGELDLPWALEVRIQKGLPIGSGMGGSAASAVAGVVALNGLLQGPLDREALFRHALAGEAAASGAAHGDNVAPCLWGGLVACLPADDGLRVVPLPLPDRLCCVLVHPHVEVVTRAARAALRETVTLHEHVAQSAHLTGFLAALHSGDLALLGDSMQDLIVGPQRRQAIPGSREAQAAANAAGAIGSGIAGSGPSLFAWVRENDAPAVADGMAAALRAAGHRVDTWTAPLGGAGAALEEA